MPARRLPLSYSFFRGFIAPPDARFAESFVVAFNESTGYFYMAPKSAVVQTRLTKSLFTRPTWALELCPENLSCVKGPTCSKLHLNEEPIMLAVKDDEPMLVCLKNGSSVRLSPSSMIVTAGLLFVSTLKSQGVVNECYPWVCQRYLKGVCTHGSKCLLLHIDPAKVKDSPMVLIEAATTFSVAMQRSLPMTPGLQPFIDTTLNRIGLRTVGDMASLSNTVFEAIMQRDILIHPANRTFWLLLLQIRNVSRTTPLLTALMQYPGIDVKTLDAVANLPNLTTVGDLCSIKARVLFSFPLRAQLLDACEKLRSRFEEEGEVYSSVNLMELPKESWYRRMATLVCEFREKHAHKSWRKQDATRPIVTSLITYVDEDTCKCSFDQVSTASEQRSPSLGHHADPSAADIKALELVPSINHWCQCPRMHQLAVNYELSTPSGSRCSEQNALGALASMGKPTTCIREVFVHGGVHNSDDPNPLFPCGVCENMFRRVSKDVQKAHGGDVMLYMFDQETNPRKLVALPIAEISHREGSHFRRFVEEDLRDDGMQTPASSVYFGLDESTHVFPAALQPSTP